MCNQTVIALLENEIAELDHALSDANDGAQQTRLRLMIESRRRQLAELRRTAA